MILVFIYMASRSYGILEKDVLKAAQTNSIEYLTLYKEYSHLKHAHYLLRPINVPFKNKWLRDTTSDLAKIDNLPLSTPDPIDLLNHFCSSLSISTRIHTVS